NRALCVSSSAASPRPATGRRSSPPNSAPTSATAFNISRSQLPPKETGPQRPVSFALFGCTHRFFAGLSSIPRVHAVYEHLLTLALRPDKCVEMFINCMYARDGDQARKESVGTSE